MPVFDVAIIGAGPVGSYTAWRLSGLGLKTAVVEKRPDLEGPVCCAGIVSPRCLDLLGLDGAPVMAEFGSAEVVSPGGQVLELNRSRPQAAVLDRGQLDRQLAGRARQAGAEYFMACEVAGLEAGTGGAVIDLKDGKSARLKARLVIAAAGFNPVLTRRLGLGAVADFVMGAQAEAEAKAAGGLKVFTGSRIAPGFFAWWVPLSDGTAATGLLARRGIGQHFGGLARFVQTAGLADRVGRPRYRGVSLKPLGRTFGQRLLVVGDMAGQVKPITAGGVYYGLRAAEVAIDITRKAFGQGDFSAAFLAGYQRRWRQELLGDIRLGRLARRVFQAMDDQRLEKIFAAVRDEKLVEKLAGDPGLEFDGHGGVVARALRMPELYRVLVRSVTG